MRSSQKLLKFKTGIGISDEFSKDIPVGIDDKTFFGKSIPDEVRAAVPLFHDSQQDDIRQALHIVLPLFSSGRSAHYTHAQSLSTISSDLCSITAGLYTVIRSAISSKSTLEKVYSDLKLMNFPDYVIDDLLLVLRRHRVNIEVSTLSRSSGFPSLAKLRWRISVTLSTTNLMNVMRPVILMQVSLFKFEA